MRRTLDEAKRFLEKPAGSLSGVWLGSLPEAGAEVLPLLLSSGHLPHLTSLDLTATPIGGKAIAELVNNPDCARLEALLFGGVEARSIDAKFSGGKRWAAMVTSDLDDEALEAISSSPWLKNLRRLDLSYAVVRPETWERFASSELVSQLTHFGAAMATDMSAQSLNTIIERTPRLEGLGLCCSNLGDDGARALIRAASSQVVRRLELALSKLTITGVRALLNAPFPKLEWIDLRGVPVDEALFSALITRTGTKALETVVLNRQTAIPTGERDIWYDQGQVVGESEGLFWLYAIDRQRFLDVGLNVTDDTASWRRGWLP